MKAQAQWVRKVHQTVVEANAGNVRMASAASAALFTRPWKGQNAEPFGLIPVLNEAPRRHAVPQEAFGGFPN